MEDRRLGTVQWFLGLDTVLGQQPHALPLVSPLLVGASWLEPDNEVAWNPLGKLRRTVAREVPTLRHVAVCVRGTAACDYQGE